MTAAHVRRELAKFASKAKAKHHQRFFRTGPGEYGEGDVFIGVTVPHIRSVAKAHGDLSLAEGTKLLKSKVHEERLLALIILVKQFETGTEKHQRTIYNLYVRNMKWVNNWDLVDTSAHPIVGGYLRERSRAPLAKWARSKNLWTRRIAIISTLHFIRLGDFKETLKLAAVLRDDEHDLMHKAVGWMLREVGNRDRPAEERFLKKHYKKMPRTMLRYAIEKFPERRRKQYLKGSV